MFIKKPWENRVSIYEDIKLNFDGTNYNLPDEAIRKSAMGFGWVPGALDGVVSHHSGSENVDVELAILLRKIALKGKIRDKVKFYKEIEKDQVGVIIDSFIEKIVELNIPKNAKLHDWIKFLLCSSSDRGAVKMGIALAGVGGYSEFLDTILTLGKHEEFTLYSAVAISNLVDDSERILWSLAKSVQGWGRIHLVERLQHTTNTDIKEWILREGYKNSIMYEYLAPIAAKTGELHNALRREEYDYELLLSASDIIEALIMEGPVVGISEYEHPKEVINRYLELTNKAMKDLAFLSTYNCIKSYLEDLELDESTRNKVGMRKVSQRLFL